MYTRLHKPINHNQLKGVFMEIRDIVKELEKTIDCKIAKVVGECFSYDHSIENEVYFFVHIQPSYNANDDVNIAIEIRENDDTHDSIHRHNKVIVKHTMGEVARINAYNKAHAYFEHAKENRYYQ